MSSNSNNKSAVIVSVGLINKINKLKKNKKTVQEYLNKSFNINPHEIKEIINLIISSQSNILFQLINANFDYESYFSIKESNERQKFLNDYILSRINEDFEYEESEIYIPNEILANLKSYIDKQEKSMLSQVISIEFDDISEPIKLIFNDRDIQYFKSLNNVKDELEFVKDLFSNSNSIELIDSISEEKSLSIIAKLYLDLKQEVEQLIRSEEIEIDHIPQEKIKKNPIPKSKFEIIKHDELLNQIADAKVNQFKRVYLNSLNEIKENSSHLKDKLQWNKKTITQLEKLKANCVNFKEICDYFIAQVAMGNENIQPILIIGENGIGKTYFVKELGKILGIDVFVENFAQTSTMFDLTGQQGQLIGFFGESLLKSKKDKQILFIDDFDKQAPNEKYSPYNAFSEILNKDNDLFRNKFFEIDMDVSKSIIIFSCNDYYNIPKNILSNLKIFEVNRVPKERLHELIDLFYTQEIGNKKINFTKEKSIPIEIKNILNGKNLTTVRTIIDEYIVSGVLNNTTPTVDDVKQMVYKQNRLEINKTADKFFEFIDKNELKYNIDDVVGNNDAKEEIKNIVKLMKGEIENSLNIDLTKGMLFKGPPGTGKTMMAKAIAKEADTNFILVTASAFKSKYLGDSEKNVRNLFNAIKKFSPCVVLIDEIDAWGNRDNKNTNSEPVGSLIQQFLTSMDNISRDSGVLIIATTNHVKNVDPAVIRKGRFDTHIKFNKLLLDDRKKYITKLLKKFKSDDENLIDVASRYSVDSSPAEIEAFINKAAYLAMMKNNNIIDSAIIEEAFFDSSYGHATHNNINISTAYHEIGHAFIGQLTSKNLALVTIIPRGDFEGVAITIPDENHNYSKKYYKDSICRVYGGYFAEKIFMGEDDIGVGTSSDIKSATDIAKAMVSKWGFVNDTLSIMNYEDVDLLSENAKHDYTKYMSDILKTQAKRCEDILLNNKVVVGELSQLLFDKKTLSQEEIHNFLVGKELYDENKNIIDYS